MGFKNQPSQLSPLLKEIHFGFLPPHRVAGMGEPWLGKMPRTHEDLRKQGIGAILTLTEDNLYGDLHRQAGFRLRHEPMDDGEAPAVAALERAVVFIDLALEKGEGVAVHCQEGRGRTGTVLGAWLAAWENLSGEETIVRLRSLRPYTALSPSQKAFLLDYLG